MSVPHRPCPILPRLAGAGLALLGALAACGSGEERGDNPEEAVKLLVGAARAGDRAGVFRRLGPATRARLETVASSSRRLTGRIALKPEDFLSVGWAPPAWEPVGMRTLNKQGTAAQVEVHSLAGDSHTVSLVREQDGWKVELPER